MRQTASKTGTGTSAWIQVGDAVDLCNRPVSFAVYVTGTVTYTVESTYDKLDGTEVAIANASYSAQTTTKEGGYAYCPYALRVNITAGTGTARLVVIT